MKDELRFALIFAGVYIHEIGDAVLTWVQGIPVVPTPAKEYILHAAQTLGRNFDLRGFHDAVLRWGPLPLGVLERKLDECLKSPDCSVTFKVIR